MMSVQLDVYEVNPPDLPPEWDPIDPMILDWLITERNEYGLQTVEQLAVEEAIIAQRWYLVRNTEGHRCRSCRQGSIPGAIHPYISVACLPRPFNGLNEVRAYFTNQVGRDLNMFTQRLGEVLVPITPEKAQDMYHAIEVKRPGSNLAWKDYWARYQRRYKEYLRTLGWVSSMLTPPMWASVKKQARKEFLAGGH